MSDVVINFTAHTGGLRDAESSFDSLIARDRALGEEARRTATTYNSRTNEMIASNSRFSKSVLAITAGNFIGNAFLSFFKSAAGAFQGFVSDIGNVTQKYEKLRALLNNTLGSNQAGEAAFAMLTKFAAETPFQLDELTAAYLKLINRGIKPTVAELTAFGDIAASQGKSFDQFTEAVLDATTGQFERLKEFGINASQLGNQVTLAFGNISKTVPKTGEAIKAALLAIRNEAPGIAGAMKIISGTTEGALSNLSDGFDRLKNAIGEKFSGALKDSIGSVSELVTAFTDLVAVPVEDKIRKEQIEFDSLIISLGNVNLSSEKRTQIIGEINSKYPQLLQNINLESASQAQLNELYKSGNKYFAERIRLEGIQAAAAGDTKEAQNVANEIGKRTNAARESLAALGVDYNKIQQLLADPKALTSFFETFDRGAARGKIQTEVLGNALSQLEDVVKGTFGNVFTNGGKSLNELIALQDKLNNKATESNRFAQDQKNISADKLTLDKKVLELNISDLQKRIETVRKLRGEDSSEFLELQKQLGELQFKLAPYAADDLAKTEKVETAKTAIVKKEKGKQKDIAAANAQAEYEIKKRALEQQAALDESISQDDSQGSSIQLLALQNYFTDKNALLALDKQKELSAKDLTEKEKLNIEDKYRVLALQANEDFLKRKADILKASGNADAAELAAANKAAQDSTDARLAAEKGLANGIYQLSEDEIAQAKLRKANDLADLENLHKRKLISEEEYLKRLAELTGNYDALNDLKRQKREETIRQIREAATQLLDQAAQAVFANNAAQRDADLQASLDAIATARDAELDNANLTAQQKADINKRYAEKEKQAKRDAFIADRNAKKTEAIIQGALNVLKAFPNPVLITAAILTTGLQVAAISSQPIPKFKGGKKRGESVPGYGLAIVDDGGVNEPIWRKDGSIELSHGKPTDRLTFLHRDDTVFTSMEHMLKSFKMPEMPALKINTPQIAELPKNIISADRFGSGQDTERLAKMIAKEIAKEMKGVMPAPVNIHSSIDKEGVRHWLENAGNRTEYLNKRYSTNNY